jgi:type I restriction enzyme S subunit
MTTMSKNISTVFQHTAVKKTGWQTAPLAELLLPQTTINPLLSPDKTFTYIDVSSVSPKTSIIQEPQVLLGKDAPSRARKVVLKNDVIFATIRPTMKRVALIPEELDNQICSTGYVVLRPKPALHPRYLFYWLFTKRFSDEMASLQRGASYPAVSDVDVRQQPIQFPQRAEQERIVAILDEAFKGIAATKAIIENSRANARQLFNSKLQSLIGSPIENWPRTNLGEQTDISTGFPFKSQGYTASDDGMKLLRGDNILQGQLRWEDVKKWPIADTEAYKDYELREGDVVLAMDRTWVKAGIKYAVLSSEDVPCLLVQRTARLRAKKTLHPKFLRWLIGSEPFTEYVLSVQTGSGVPHISGPQIKAFEFQLPPMKDQCLIASLLDELSSETARLDGVYSQKLSALDALKQSFLQSAFSKSL